jgi:hypothetical protein
MDDPWIEPGSEVASLMTPAELERANQVGKEHDDQMVRLLMRWATPSRKASKMPVDPSVPEPLKTALEEMERSVQQFKTGLSYQAPEQHRELWINLQQELAGIITTVYLDGSA